MKVVLVEDVREANGDIKVVRRGDRNIVYEGGAVLDVSDATGEKWVELGIAEELPAGDAGSGGGD